MMTKGNIIQHHRPATTLENVFIPCKCKAAVPLRKQLRWCLSSELHSARFLPAFAALKQHCRYATALTDVPHTDFVTSCTSLSNAPALSLGGCRIRTGSEPHVQGRGEVITQQLRYYRLITVNGEQTETG